MAYNRSSGATKVAILLPSACDAGWLLRGRALAQAVAAAGFRAEVGLTGAPPDRPVPEHLASGFRDLPGVGYRRLAWQTVPAEIFTAIHGPALLPSGVAQVSLPFDWGWHFLDCDVWLLCGDPGLGLVPALRPSLVYCRDLAMRYVPEGFAASTEDPAWDRLDQAFLGWRAAAALLVADPFVARDLADYAGIRRNRIHCLAPLLGTEAAPRDSAAAPMLLWWLAAGEALPAEAASALARLLAAVPGLRVVVAGPGAAQATLPLRHDRLSLVAEDGEAERRFLLGQATLLCSAAATAFEGDAAWLAACGPGRLVAPDLPELTAAASRLGVALHPCPSGEPTVLAATLASAVRAGPVSVTPTPAPAQPALAALLQEVLRHAAA